MMKLEPVFKTNRIARQHPLLAENINNADGIQILKSWLARAYLIFIKIESDAASKVLTLGKYSEYKIAIKGNHVLLFITMPPSG